MSDAVYVRTVRDISLDALERVAYQNARVTLDEALLSDVEAAHQAFLRYLDAGGSCYGVTTGFGALAGTEVPPEARGPFQRRALLGAAAGTGPPIPAQVVRGMLLVRLVNFLSCRSGVSAALCRFVVDRLNEGFTPWVPSRGLSTAGEIIPLAHLAQTFVGEGFLLGPNGERIPAHRWFEERELRAYEPKMKEGLALIGGTASSPPYAYHAVRKLDAALHRHTLVASASIEALAAPLEAYAPEVDTLRPEPGIGRVNRSLRRMLEGTRIRRRAGQAPVSFRVVPHVHGAAMDALEAARQTLARELAGVSDNPIFLAGNPGRVLSSGTFHNQHLVNALEGLAPAMAHVGLLSVRRVHRLLDPRFSGLRPQLANTPGLDRGLVVVHKAMLAYAARLRLMASPTSLEQADASFGQEDAMTMIFPVIDRLLEIGDLLGMLAAHELYVALVALDERGELPGTTVEALRRRVRDVVPTYQGDRPYGPEIEALGALMQDPAFEPLLSGSREDGRNGE